MVGFPPITFTSLGKEIDGQSDAYGVPVSNVKASSTKSFSCMDCLPDAIAFLGDPWFKFILTYGIMAKLWIVSTYVNAITNYIL